MKPGDIIAGERRKYEIIEQLRENYQVYRARGDDEHISRHVIKGFGCRTHFDTEARVHSIIRDGHPNLIRCEEIIYPQYVVLPYLHGKTLYEVIARHSSLTLDAVLTIFSGICSGLAHLHSHGLAHGDLHMLNIILTPTPVLFDFNLSNGNIQRDIVKVARTLENTLHWQGYHHSAIEEITGKAVDEKRYSSIMDFWYDLLAESSRENRNHQ